MTNDGRFRRPVPDVRHSSFVIPLPPQCVSYATFALRRRFVPLLCPQFFPVTNCIKSGLAQCGGLPTWWRTKVDSGAPVGRSAMCATGLMPEIANLFSLDVSNTKRIHDF